MNCPNCGKKVMDDTIYCPGCGARVLAQSQPTAQAYSQQPFNNQQAYGQQPFNNQPYGQQPFNNQVYGGQPFNNQMPAYTMPMNWFKFLIYVMLFLSAGLNVFSAVQLFTGMHYGSEWAKEMVYWSYPSLQTADIMYGVFACVAAIIAIVARFTLAAYKKIGPKLITALYLVSIISGIVYIVMFVCIVGSDVEVASVISAYIIQMLVSVIMCGANYTYFKKRAHMFTK